MIMNRATGLLATACLTAAIITAFAPGARADEFQMHGNRLVLTLNGNNDSTIDIDSSLHDAIRISGENAGCLTNHGGGGVISIDDSTCNEDLDGLKIDVPANYPLILTMHGSGNVTMGNLEGQLVATVSGNGDLHAGRVAGLVLNMTGSGDASVQAAEGPAEITIAGNGDVKIPLLNGPLHVRQSGAGDLSIGAIDAPAADFTLQGSGDAAIGHGSVGALRAQVHGSGDLVMAATALTADLTASGGGDIRIADVTGMVSRHSSGGSSISTHASGLERLGVGGLANLISSSSDDDDGHGSNVHVYVPNGGRVFHHLLAGAFVVFVLFMIWRTVQRRGGINAVSNAMRARGAPTQPTHPGVLAVRDTLARLEGRLARVEGYVTEREFELHRKFRDLETK
jgi:hypothetical protein